MKIGKLIVKALAFTLLWMPIYADAYEWTNGNVKYTFTVVNGEATVSRVEILDCDIIGGVNVPSRVLVESRDGFNTVMTWYPVRYVEAGNVGGRLIGGLYSCTGVAIGNGIIEIGANVFKGYAKFTHVGFPTSIRKVGMDAFAGCGELGIIDIEADELAAWCNIDFANAGANPLTCTKNGLGWIDRSLYINGYPVTRPYKDMAIPYGISEIKQYAFCGHKSLETVEFPWSCEKIGTCAFSGCANLTALALTNNITSIGDGAFHGCYSLRTLTMNSSVTNIGAGAFQNCGLYTVSLGSGLTSVSSNLFQGCSSLLDVDLGANIKKIGAYAFQNCTSLTNVVFPSGLTSIEDRAFEKTPVGNGTTDGYRGIALPNTVTNIGSYAFHESKSMYYFIIPTSVKTLGTDITKSCDNLINIIGPRRFKTYFQSCNPTAFYTYNDVKVTFDANGGEVDTASMLVDIYSHIAELPVPTRSCHTFLGWFTAAEGGTEVTSSTSMKKDITLYAHWEKWPDVTFNVNGGEAIDETLRTMPRGEQVGELPVPWKWDHVFKGWFTAADGGDEVTADTVVTADMTLYAQWETANYEWSYEDNYDGGITITGVSPLTGGITIPSEIDGKSVTAIGERAFSGYECNAEGFRGVIIPEGVTRLQWQAFAGSSSLEIVELPESLIEIGGAAFSGCKITAIVIPTSVQSISWSAFGGCTNLSTVTFDGDESSIDINGSAFKNTALPFSLVVNEGVLIGYRGVCPTNLVIGDYVSGVTEIGDAAFRSDGISSITIPASITNIHWEAFCECQNLSEVVFLGDKNDIDIHESAFAGTPYEASLPFELIIRDGVLTGFTGACPMELTIPNSVSVIGSSVFYRSQHPSVDNLERVIFSEGLETIGDMSFFNCWNLREILLPSTVTNIEYGAFSACHSVTNIVLNEGLLSIQDEAFGGGTTTNITLPTTVREVSREAFRGTEGTVTVHAPWSLWGILDSGEVYQEYWSGGSYVTTTRVDVVFYGDAPDFYTLTFNENGGDSLGEPDKIVMDGRAIGILPIPTRNGYAFAGWFTAAEGGDEVTEDTVVSADMTLYAHWEEITYTYNYIDNGDGTVTLSRYDEYGNWIDPISPSPVGDFEIPAEIDGKPVVAIGGYVFEGYLTSVTIPASVTNITAATFDYSYQLTNITVVADNPAYKSIDGILYTKDGKTLVKCPGFKGGDIVVEPDTERIGQSAFSFNSYLTSVSLPNGLKAIEYNAFRGCYDVTSMTIPASVEAIGAYSFGYCISLETVNFLGIEGDIAIAATAFVGTPYNATKSFALIIDEYETLVGIQGVAPENLVISNCLNGLTLTRIGSSALSGWNYGTSSMTNVVVPEGVVWIGDYAFAGDSALESVSLPMSLQSIGYGAFGDCSSLRTITIPSGVTYVDNAFWGCTNLTVRAPETLRDTFSVPETCTIEYYAVPQHTVTFNANGGQIDGAATAEWTIREGSALGSGNEYGRLPTPTLSGYAFSGWFTAASGGELVTAETVVTTNMTLYARWEESNDNFADARTLTGVSGMVYGSNVGAGVEDNEPLLGQYNTSATVWWRWTAPRNGSVTFTTAGSDFDTLMGVYQGTSISGFVTVGENDDGGVDTTSSITFDVVSDTTYYIAVGGYGDAVGNVILNWNVATDSEDVTVTIGGKTVTVPGTWLSERTQRAATDTAANGRKVWECYALGLNPEDNSATNDFRITSFPLKADGTPDIEHIVFDPPQAKWNVPATYRVKGAANLDDVDWPEVTEGNKGLFRFFKVELVLP